MDPEIWRRVKHSCIDANIEYSSFVEDVLNEALRRKK